LDDSGRDAYVAGLTLLARRELSEKQVRQRLRRKEFADEDVETAIARLKSERALDDSRFAHALARQEILTKRHGRLRAQRQLEAAGVSGSLANAALDEALAQVDQEALIDSALSRRLRGGAAIEDEAQFRRLYRFLIGQGFDSERVLRTLKRRRSRAAGGATH
jgi:regulatory protein